VLLVIAWRVAPREYYRTVGIRWADPPAWHAKPVTLGDPAATVRRGADEGRAARSAGLATSALQHLAQPAIDGCARSRARGGTVLRDRESVNRPEARMALVSRPTQSDDRLKGRPTEANRTERGDRTEIVGVQTTGLMVAFAAVAVGLAALLVLRLRGRNRDR